MKELFFIDDILENRISYYHLAVLLMVLPFDAFYSDMVLASFTIHTLMHIRKDHLPLLLSKQVLLMASLYVLSLAGILYSCDKEQGWADVSNQLPFLLLPVLFALTNIDLEKYKLRLFKLFGIVCVMVIICLFVNALQVIRYFQLPYSSLFKKEFINQKFSEPLLMHSTFLSIYVAFSLVVFLFFFIKEKIIIQKIIYGILVFILLAGLFQLSSRAVFIALLCTILIFPFLLLQGNERIRFITTALIIIAGLFIIIKEDPSFKQRYVTELKDDLTQPSTSNEIKEPRILRWKAELELVEASPVIGYGTGSEKIVLEEKYFDKKLFFSYLAGFNAHSQYLSFLITLGIFGLAAYLCILAYGFYIAVKTKDIFFMTVLILIAVVSIAEDIMTISRGRLFYSFFVAFFLLMYQRNRTGINYDKATTP